jgi:hypothetical protein
MAMCLYGWITRSGPMMTLMFPLAESGLYLFFDILRYG